MMKFGWDPEKNERPKQEPHVSFEQIIFHLQRGDIWKIADHPNQAKTPGQHIYFVNVEGYVYLVPFIQKDRQVFLKTIIPSRKATKAHQKQHGDACNENR